MPRLFRSGQKHKSAAQSQPWRKDTQGAASAHLVNVLPHTLPQAFQIHRPAARPRAHPPGVRSANRADYSVPSPLSPCSARLMRPSPPPAPRLGTRERPPPFSTLAVFLRRLLQRFECVHRRLQPLCVTFTAVSVPPPEIRALRVSSTCKERKEVESRDLILCGERRKQDLSIFYGETLFLNRGGSKNEVEQGNNLFSSKRAMS